MKSGKALEKFMLDQATVVSKVMGTQFINLAQFAREVGVTRKHAEKLVTQGRVRGAQKIDFGKCAHWIIPINHNYSRRNKVRVDMVITKEGFMDLLNQAGPGSRLTDDGLEIMQYGSWLKTNHKEEFDAKYEEFVAKYKGGTKYVAPGKRPKGSFPSNEKLFPL